jgi:hypothetical protein
MVKKVSLLLFLAAIAAGGAWAQSARNWISGGFNSGFLFVTGGPVVNYEYLFPAAKEQFSITGQIGTRILAVPQVLVGGRWYPAGGGSGNPGTKFHLDAKLGYGLGGFAYEGALGWKMDPGSPNGFFMDLSLVMGLPVLFGVEFTLGMAF